MTEKQEKRLIEALELIAIALANSILSPRGSSHLCVKYDNFIKGR